jgi:hypothetical protein
MADPEDRCFHTTYYSLEADEVFGFSVEWAQHPILPGRRVVKIIKIGRNCKFNKEEIRLKIDDIITDINGREITSLDKFKRKVNERTTFRVLLQDGGDGGVVPPPVPIAIITDKPSNTARKRQRDEHQDDDTETNKEQPESSPVMPNVLYRSPSPPPEGFTTPAVNVPEPEEPPKVRGEILLYPPNRCEGITEDILRSYNCNDTDVIVKGFYNLLGVSLRWQASYLSNHQNFPYADTTLGFLKDATKNDDFGYTWEAVRVGNQCSFHRMSCRKNRPMGVENDVGLAAGTNCCCDCYQHRANFVKLCRKEQQLYMEQEKGNIALKNHNHDKIKYRSPSLVIPLIRDKSREIRVLKRKCAREKEWRKKLKEDGVYISNVNAEVLFAAEELQRCYDELLEKDIITDDDIRHFLFQECIAVNKRIKAYGNAQGHTYSPLLIQFAVMLRDKCSISSYDFFRKAFNLPANSTLCRYSNADSTSPDGLMMETIIQMATIYNNLEILDLHWLRYLNC